MTFFEAVESLRLPKPEEGDKKKQAGQKKPKELGNLSPRLLLSKIDLSGFKNLRFSRAGLQDLILGVDRLPCIRSISLKNNGINDDHSQEILALFSINKIKAIDLSCNDMCKLGGQIGKKLRDEISHI